MNHIPKPEKTPQAFKRLPCWFPRDRLPDNLIPYVRRALTLLREGTAYSAEGWDG